MNTYCLLYTSTVATTVSETAIEQVEVVSNDETVGIGSYAIERIPAAIVENQTAGVDGVSGATATSNAILSAVRDALNAAGADMAIYNRTPEAPEAVNAVSYTHLIGISSFCDPNRSYPDIVPVRIAEYGQPDRVACRAMVWHKDCTHPCVGAMLAILDQMAKEKPSRNGIYPFD